MKMSFTLDTAKKIFRRVNLKAHFHDKEQPSDEPQRDELESLKPKKSNWTPPDGRFTSIDLFVNPILPGRGGAFDARANFE